jgi:hypothetical protein
MGKGHGDKQSRKKEQAIAALLSSPTIASAAKAVGVSERTIRNWLKDPEFAAAYRRARQQVVEVTIGRIQQLTAPAAHTMEELLEEGSPAERLRVASMVMTYALKGLETADTQARLEEMERRIAELAPGERRP